MVDSNVHPEKSKLCRIIEENLPGASIISYARKYFRDDLGMEYINQVIPLKNDSLMTAYIGGRCGKCQGRDICQVNLAQIETNEVIMQYPLQLQSSSKVQKR